MSSLLISECQQRKPIRLLYWGRETSPVLGGHRGQDGPCSGHFRQATYVLTLSEIYQAISARHPYYRMDARNWQNSIRHNLTLNKSFNKVPRSSNEGRGSYWKLENGAEANIFKRGSRHLQQTKVRESSNYHQQTIFTDSDGHQIVHDGGEVHTSIVQTESDPTAQQVIYVTIPTN